MPGSLASPGLGPICLVLIASLAPFSFPTFGTTLTQGNTRLCQVVLGWAGPALRNTVAQPGYSCPCLFARSLLFSLSVFLIINVGLAGSPGWWKPQWKSVQTSASENAAGSVSARLGRQWQILLLRAYLKTCSHHNSPAWVQHPWQGLDFCQHTLTKQAWRICPGIPVSHL